VIEKHGYQTYCLGAAGDILAKSDGRKVWKIGIQDPFNKAKILEKLSITSGAVATSGSYERGRHIINPKTGQPADELLSLTIAGPDIVKADILATAGFAMGLAGLGFIGKVDGYSAIGVDHQGRIFFSSGSLKAPLGPGITSSPRD
jgi:thiamine biosynthesis lipoprotein